MFQPKDIGGRTTAEILQLSIATSFDTRVRHCYYFIIIAIFLLGALYFAVYINLSHIIYEEMALDYLLKIQRCTCFKNNCSETKNLTRNSLFYTINICKTDFRAISQAIFIALKCGGRCKCIYGTKYL